MTKSKVDRRNIKTKESIKNAFLELIKEKNINEISVTDLTTKADINRGTFYLHYTDKYDLINQLENEIILSFNDTFKTISKDELIGFSVGSKTPSFSIELFKYFKEHASFMKAILSTNGDPLFHHKLKKTLESMFLKDFWKNEINEDTMLVPKEYFYSYVVSAHIGLVRHWLETGTKESPEEMASILLNLFLIGPFNTLNINTKENSTKKESIT